MNSSLPFLKLIKRIFPILFILLLFMYLFLDDGGLATKTGWDFLAIPIVSFVFASFFTLGIGFFFYVYQRIR